MQPVAYLYRLANNLISLPMNKLILTPFFVLLAFAGAGQLVVNTPITPAQFVNSLVGSGVIVSNITYSGDADQIGEFDATATVLGIPEGVILATGTASLAIGPNNSGSTTLGGGNFGVTDPDLDAIIGPAGGNDAAILEFDFIPAGDTVKFNYIFGSEEYLEFVNGGFNDAFGFFLSGPGIAGPYMNAAVNIALIPGTTTPVTIDNVNTGLNAAYYVVNGTGTNAPYNTGVQYIQLDGHTVVLEAKYPVQCGQTYHIKLAIADAGDASWDSGVFLQAGSFSSEQVEVNVTTVSGDDEIYEGCSPAIFTFVRPDTTGQYVVYYDIAGNAINGMDYPFLADSIVFPGGVDSVDLIVVPLQDMLTEGTDTLTLIVYTVNPCGDTLISEGTIYILDAPDVIIGLQDTTLTCPVTLLEITANPTGGEPPYTFFWSNGQTGPTLSIPNPSVDDTLIVQVEDACSGLTFSDTLIIDVQFQPLSVVIQSDTTIQCPGDLATLQAVISGGYSPYSYVWSNGNMSSTLNVFPNTTTDYWVTISDSCGLVNLTDTATVTVPNDPLVLTVVDDTVTCPNDAVTIGVVASGGAAPYGYLWNTGDATSTATVAPATTTSYTVNVNDVCGRLENATVTVVVPVYPAVVVDPIADDTLCLGSEGTYQASASGGEGSGYSYTWSAGTTVVGTSNPISFYPPETYTFTVTATDVCGNSGFVDFDLVVEACEIFVPNIITPNSDGMNDAFYVVNLDRFENRVVIYNRWGTKVFDQENYQNDWDGDNQVDGTYFYVITYIRDDEEQCRSGHVTLVKD
jgi:gliding motility-associated-like protein